MVCSVKWSICNSYNSVKLGEVKFTENVKGSHFDIKWYCGIIVRKKYNTASNKIFFKQTSPPIFIESRLSKVGQCLTGELFEIFPSIVQRCFCFLQNGSRLFESEWRFCLCKWDDGERSLMPLFW